MAIDATDEFLMYYLSQEVKRVTGKQGKELNKILEVLTTPKEISYVSRERKELLLLAMAVKNKKFKINSKEFRDKLSGLLEDYWWTNLGWKKGAKKSLADYQISIKEIIENTDVKNELHTINNYARDIEEKRKLLFNDKKLLKIVNLINLNDDLAILHDVRKEVQMKSNFWVYALFDKFSKKTGINSAYFNWMDTKEIFRALKDKKVNKKIKNRLGHYFCYYNNGKVTRVEGKGADKIYNSTVKIDSKAKDIQGVSASSGYARGKAYVALSIKDAMNMEKGDILVTGMTTPDFVPAMRRASAIVTDEGGITCHAAIVSRELGIPCIVGTKFATKLIKTGQIIEVKANHGTVIIIQ